MKRIVGDDDGESPLHHCEHVEAAQLLVDAHANKDVKNAEGKTVRGLLFI